MGLVCDPLTPRWSPIVFARPHSERRVSHPVLSTLTVQPGPLFSASTPCRGRWLATWLTTTADAMGVSNELVSAREYLLTFRRAHCDTAPVASKHILKPATTTKSWNIWLLKQAARLAPTTQYLGVRPRRICGFFFQVLLFLSASSCLAGAKFSRVPFMLDSS